MLAIGVGGADAVDALTGTPWELKAPKIIGKVQHYGVARVLRIRRCSPDWRDERLGHT